MTDQADQQELETQRLRPRSLSLPPTLTSSDGGGRASRPPGEIRSTTRIPDGSEPAVAMIGRQR